MSDLDSSEFDDYDSFDDFSDLDDYNLGDDFSEPDDYDSPDDFSELDAYDSPKGFFEARGHDSREPVKVVYTDGACRGNPGPGGWAWVVPGGRWACGASAHTTNQRMELQAVLEALRELRGPMEVVSDSRYVVDCFRDKWYRNWQKRSWRTASGKPVSNQDLWIPLLSLYYRRPSEISFRWVKGHGGDEFNEMADQLACAAADDQRSRRGPRRWSPR